MEVMNDDMDNIRELLLYVVKWRKPKVLIGLDQKIRGLINKYVH